MAQCMSNVTIPKVKGMRDIIYAPAGMFWWPLSGVGVPFHLRSTTLNSVFPLPSAWYVQRCASLTGIKWVVYLSLAESASAIPLRGGTAPPVSSPLSRECTHTSARLRDSGVEQALARIHAINVQRRLQASTDGVSPLRVGALVHQCDALQIAHGWGVDQSSGFVFTDTVKRLLTELISDSSRQGRPQAGEAQEYLRRHQVPRHEIPEGRHITAFWTTVTRRNASSGPPRVQKRCSACGQPGHNMSTCQHVDRDATEPPSAANAAPRRAKRRRRCSVCNLHASHDARNCPHRAK